MSNIANRPTVLDLLALCVKYPSYRLTNIYDDQIRSFYVDECDDVPPIHNVLIDDLTLFKENFRSIDSIELIGFKNDYKCYVRLDTEVVTGSLKTYSLPPPFNGKNVINAIGNDVNKSRWWNYDLCYGGYVPIYMLEVVDSLKIINLRSSD